MCGSIAKKGNMPITFENNGSECDVCNSELASWGGTAHKTEMEVPVVKECSTTVWMCDLCYNSSLGMAHLYASTHLDPNSPIIRTIHFVGNRILRAIAEANK